MNTLDRLELGDRVALDVFAENRATARRWGRYLARIVRIAQLRVEES